MSFISRFDCDWYCDECDAYLNSQPGFTVKNDEWTCTECGAVNDVTEDNIIVDDDINHDYNDYDYNNYDDINEVPEGCRACGGNYPYCCDSCPLFDE